MGKPYTGKWVIRSLLFVPGHIENMLVKGSNSEADAVVLDLEDAVPDENKAEARETIRRVLEAGTFAKKPAFVRINPLESGLTLKDLEGVACAELDGFIYPMSDTADDIRSFDAQLRLIEMNLGLPRGHFSIIILFETAKGILNTQEISRATKRAIALLFGCEDYLADIEGRHSEMDISLHVARSNVVLAARAVGIDPIDTPYIHVHDMEGLRRFATRARDLGMSGMALMTPKQIPIVHEVYSPDPEAVATAKKIVEGYEEAKREGRGILVVDGRFVSPPTLKSAQKLLARYDSIQQMKE